MSKSTKPQAAEAKAAVAKKAAAKKAAAKKAPAKKAKKPAATGDRSAAIAASWGDPKVAAARNTKQKVKVNGTEYNSVGAAFRELKLPVGQSIRFRMALKASESGRKVFETEKGDKYTFTLVHA